jgi:hypothetical protein
MTRVARKARVVRNTGVILMARFGAAAEMLFEN